MLLKDMPVSLKAGPDDGLADGQFTAYASVFGNKDSYGDVVIPGAFANTLKAWDDSGNPIPLLFGHNMTDPDYNIGAIVKAVEDDHGLLVTGQLDLDNPKAAQVYRMLKGRRINQMSFAYDVLDGGEATKAADDGSDPESYYELRELKLYEVSVVTIGANQDTEVLAVKANADALLYGVKAGRVLSAKNESALKTARDHIDSVLKALDGSGNEAAGDGGDDQEKASGATATKADASDEAGNGKSSASAEESKSATVRRDLAAIQFNTYAVAYATENGV